MDFKTRFQGKISKITKDGTIDDVIMSTEKMAPIGKTAGAGGGYGGTGTGGLITPTEPSTPFENNLDGVSVGFSYQGGLGASAGTGGGPLYQQPSQQSRVIPVTQKPAAPGFKQENLASFNYDASSSNQGSTSSAVMKSQLDGSNNKNLLQPDMTHTPVQLKTKLQSSNTANTSNNQYGSISTSKVGSSSISTIDIAKDNIYLKGGSSLADALMSHQRNNNNGQSQNGLSIAMRMKKNREAATGVTPSQAQPIIAIEGKAPGLKQENSSHKSSFLDTLQANMISNPTSSQLSNQVISTAQQSVRTNQQSMNSQAKPPSGTQQMRHSVERQRSTSFVSVSKQIVGGPVKNLDSIRSYNEDLISASKNGSNNGPQTLDVSLNDRLKNNQQSVKRNNSYAVKTQQPSTIQVASSNDQLQKRAMSVANQPSTLEDSNIHNPNASPVMKTSKVLSQQNSSSLQVPRRAGAFRSAGIKDQLNSKEKPNDQQSKLTLHGQNIMNSNPLVSNPYQQQFMQMNNNVAPVSPEQLQHQLLMMQQQILLLQQQQSMFSPQAPPNSSPPMLYNKQNSPTKLPGQGQAQNRVSDVYRQIEAADKKFMNQGTLIPQVPYNIPAGSLTGQVGGYGPQGNNSSSPITMADPYYYQQLQQKGIGGIMLDSQSTVSEGGKGQYKRYTVKDYKQLQQTVQSLKMGGLGANIGSEEWEKAKKKLDAAQEYAKSLRSGQSLQSTANLGSSNGAIANPNSWSSQQLKRATQEQKQKVQTSREKAIEFAKSIPKPKVKGPQNNLDQQSSSSNQWGGNDTPGDLNGVIEEEAFDEYGNTLKGSEFNDLNYRHDHLQGEVDKIKKLFN